uniref:DNA polymerase sigma subunit n=1 Tax=Tetraselmis sp. GSL018 TaxID=582737 RepID=A0A061RAZ6_9CHLO
MGAQPRGNETRNETQRGGRRSPGGRSPAGGSFPRGQKTKDVQTSDGQQVAALGEEIFRFAGDVVPTPEEQRRREDAYSAVKIAVASVFPRAEVELFGSEASDLSLHNSDIDVVVLNVETPPPDGRGFPTWQRPQVASKLRKILGELRRRGIVSRANVIAQARIPIAKCSTVDGIELDISLGNRSSCLAAEWQRQATEWPLLRPLVLVIKALLKDNHISEVSQGGLGSFSVMNMVLAVLLGSPKDLEVGTLLLRFLRIFGDDFDYGASAVSVGRGGFVSKASVMYNGYNDDLCSIQNPGDWSFKLCIEDPTTHRDISGGSFRIADVRALFQTSLRRLNDKSRSHGRSAGSSALLPRIMDVASAVDRPGKRSAAGPQTDAQPGSKRPRTDGGAGPDQPRGASGKAPRQGGLGSGSELFMQRLIENAKSMAGQT